MLLVDYRKGSTIHDHDEYEFQLLLSIQITSFKHCRKTSWKQEGRNQQLASFEVSAQSGRDGRKKVEKINGRTTKIWRCAVWHVLCKKSLESLSLVGRCYQVPGNFPGPKLYRYWKKALFQYWCVVQILSGCLKREKT